MIQRLPNLPFFHKKKLKIGCFKIKSKLFFITSYTISGFLAPKVSSYIIICFFARVNCTHICDIPVQKCGSHNMFRCILYACYIDINFYR